MATEQAYVAATRFGYGPRPGDLVMIASDPKGWLRDQVENTDLPTELRNLGPSAPLLAETQRQQQGAPQAYVKYLKGEARDVLGREVGRRTMAAIRSGTPFRERLVHFWSNHFTISVKRPQIIAAAGAFEREAIRPNIFGTFADLLVAVTQHPVMLMYLDNQFSFGPNSPAGRQRDFGLNDNLAREILELHTLGVDGGYTQDDVIGLAKLLTGWGVARPQDRSSGTPGAFVFRAVGHEPGTKTLLTKTYRQNGVRSGEEALRDVARHPATARFVATKLATHFVADEPSAASISRLEKVFKDTGGDLRALTLALIDIPETWDAPLSKFKTPNDLIISSLRALNVNELADQRIIGALGLLNQFPFTAPSPAGWSDKTADWMTPEALMTRIEWLRALGNVSPVPNPVDWAESIVGPVLSDETRTTVAQAQSRTEAVALVFSSPEFQRK
ncbi:MAG: DUF1800 domain-containing protein [Alphaproteobacteria bacterium]